MAEHDEAIRRYLSFHPQQFAVFDKLKLYQKSTGGKAAHILFLELWLRTSQCEYDDSRRLHLSFENVSSLKIHPRGFIQISLLEITLIKEYQWENLKYRISDIEENQIFFYCNLFEANIVEAEETRSNV